MPTSRTIKGVAVATGLAVGRVHLVRSGAQDVPTWFVRVDEVPAEIGRLANALTAAAEELERKQRVVAREAGAKDAEILAVHRMILQDPSALRDVEALISGQRINAESAVKQLIERFEKTLGALDGNASRGYAADVSDPWRRVLDVLLQRDREELSAVADPVVLAAPELTPQVVTYLPRDRVLAIVCEKGGRFSHGAVLARSMGIPCVVGLPNLFGRLEQDLLVAVDGDQGQLLLRPGDRDLEFFRRRLARRRARQAVVSAEAAEPAVTTDGHRLLVEANIEGVRDLETFELATIDGVGLLRTEFLYMERGEFPSEEEQYRLYRRVLEQLPGRSVTIRTLDIGGDKPLPYFKTPPERNPALGWRGLRISLEWPDLLQVQLRALLRASAHGDLRVLLPMIGSLEQVEQVHALFDQARDSLTRQGYELAADVPVGAMVEVPSALLCLPAIVPHVDFVSVGTNDLVQYLLAVDRDNAWVAKLYDPHHPVVPQALERVASVARAAGRPAGVCGDIAGDPATALLLLGLGFDSVSMAPQFVAEVKYAVRRATIDQAQQYAARSLACTRAAEMRELLAEIRDWIYAERPSGDSVPV